MFRPVLAATLFFAFPAPTLGQATADTSEQATVRLMPPALSVTITLKTPTATTVSVDAPPEMTLPLQNGGQIHVPITEPERTFTAISNGRISVALPPEPAPPAPGPVVAPLPIVTAPAPELPSPTVGELLGSGQTVQIIDLQFDFDSAVLTEGSRPALATVGEVLAADPSLQLLVRGHTDAQGSTDYNLNLSKRRADAVRDALITWYGISPDRIRTEGLGMTEPVATNATEDGRRQNRRVEFVPSR